MGRVADWTQAERVLTPTVEFSFFFIILMEGKLGGTFFGFVGRVE